MNYRKIIIEKNGKAVFFKGSNPVFQSIGMVFIKKIRDEKETFSL